MTTDIDYNDMDLDVRGNPGNLSLIMCPYFGLVISVFSPPHNYYSWRQTRKYGTILFDLQGKNSQPEHSEYLIWCIIDSDYLNFYTSCCRILGITLDKYFARTATDYDCAKSILQAMKSRSVWISRITFVGSNDYDVMFEYDGSHDYYLWPILEFKNGVINSVYITS